MGQLSLETFVTAGGDFEASQYRIRQALKGYRDEFTRSKLYPALAELIELTRTLESLIEEKTSFQQQLPRELKNIDLKNKKLIFESVEMTGNDFERIVELIRWALPLIGEIIQEGMRIFDFVDENLAVQHVGILPMYKDEGYYFVPENKASLLHLLRYEASLYTSGSEHYRALKTSALKSIQQSPVRSTPESIKRELIEEHRDLPNPATFLCETDLEFPFAETILPVAKRKLMASVFS